MPLVTVVIVLAVVGLLLWLVNRYIPMQGQIKAILNGVIVIAVVLWLLKVVGLFDNLSQYRIGHDTPLIPVVITLCSRPVVMAGEPFRSHAGSNQGNSEWCRRNSRRPVASQSIRPL